MKTIFLNVIALTFLTCSAFAQDKPKVDEEMMKKWKEYSTPGEQHKVLASAAGKWTYTQKAWHTPESKPEETKGTADFKMILGGRYLQQDVKGKAMGQDYQGHGMVGFDNLSKEFNSVWMDNFGTGILQGKGSWNAETKTINEKGDFTCPMSESQKAEYRADWVWVDNKTMTYTMYVKGMKGHEAEFKMMEMTYKKK